ncbi:MAG: gamma-glutamyltranspeptidase / glutathione hydrolase, partial [Gammaproteobacteria bacterium]|nr:gamma-glutamyltranspeptidase / glutathione hydrolase [Gammaproteobacteria bacterium]
MTESRFAPRPARQFSVVVLAIAAMAAAAPAAFADDLAVQHAKPSLPAHRPLTAPAAVAHKAAIASAYPLASQAGQEILAAGGNAFDAAVAVSAALAVVEPSSSGLGGGGFYLLHRQSDGYETMLDAREKAPGAASRDMYLDKDGNAVESASIAGALAAGIPGEPAAFEYLARKYGKLSLKQSLQPAIRLARGGFP